jgi:hypothetical protein
MAGIRRFIIIWRLCTLIILIEERWLFAQDSRSTP